MLDKLLRYIYTIAVGIAAVSCGDSLDTPTLPAEPDSPGTITLRFSNSDRTRSAESDASETLIDNLIVGLFPDGPDEDVPAIIVGRFAGLKADGNATVTMILDDTTVSALFNDTDGASCRLYALANIPEATADVLPANPTIRQMKDAMTESPFKESKLQEAFVMAGAGSVRYTAGTNDHDPGKASGNGDLYRAASKINLRVSLPASITLNQGEENEEVWIPEQTGIQVLLNNGVDRCVAAPDNEWQPESAEWYYNSEMGEAESKRELKNQEGTGTYSYRMDVPFYTYPNSWTESLLETNKTTMTLIVPWRRQGSSTWNTYYYMVPVTPSDLPRIDANYSYTVNLSVGMLGSLVPETPIELDPLSYQVVDWSAEDIDVDIKDYRYLVVNPNVVTVNNEAEMLIPFYSSHSVDISNISMTFQRFNFYSDGNGEVVNIDVPKNKLDLSTATVDGNTTNMVEYEIYTDQHTNQKYVKIKHALEIWNPVNASGATVNLTGRNGTGNNTLEAVTNSIVRFVRPANPEAAYSSYTFNVHIQHGDNPSYSEDIAITQYPGMYIEADRNPGGSYNTSNDNSNYQSDYGFVFVNPTFNQGSRRDYWTNSTALGGVHGLTGQNKNPNMYVINISQLDAGSEFIIGDPRTLYINNDLTGNGSIAERTSDQTTVGNWSEAGEALYPGGATKRKLQYYYPTREVAATDKNAYMVAPKIRIASSWGVTNHIYRQDARRRAASYQERGYPAGRWRLPTLGEFTFITQLSAAGKIPTLFSLNNNYLTAQGVYQVDRNGNVTAQTNANTTAIRAVYDEWYWENSAYNLDPNATSYVYTYGDMPRDKQ